MEQLACPMGCLEPKLYCQGITLGLLLGRMVLSLGENHDIGATHLRETLPPPPVKTHLSQFRNRGLFVLSWQLSLISSR